jgi:hypothetical protein
VRALPCRIKQGIYAFAVLLLAGLAVLKWLAVDQRLFLVLGISSGLLVVMLLMTYRVFAGVAEAARNAPQSPDAPQDNRVEDDEDEDQK